jgi:hypothetical protein
MELKLFEASKNPYYAQLLVSIWVAVSLKLSALTPAIIKPRKIKADFLIDESLILILLCI